MRSNFLQRYFFSVFFSVDKFFDDQIFIEKKSFRWWWKICSTSSFLIFSFMIIFSPSSFQFIEFSFTQLKSFLILFLVIQIFPVIFGLKNVTFSFVQKFFVLITRFFPSFQCNKMNKIFHRRKKWEDWFLFFFFFEK